MVGAFEGRCAETWRGGAEAAYVQRRLIELQQQPPQQLEHGTTSAAAAPVNPSPQQRSSASQPQRQPLITPATISLKAATAAAAATNSSALPLSPPSRSAEASSGLSSSIRGASPSPVVGSSASSTVATAPLEAVASSLSASMLRPIHSNDKNNGNSAIVTSRPPRPSADDASPAIDRLAGELRHSKAATRRTAAGFANDASSVQLPAGPAVALSAQSPSSPFSSSWPLLPQAHVLPLPQQYQYQSPPAAPLLAASNSSSVSSSESASYSGVNGPGQPPSASSAFTTASNSTAAPRLSSPGPLLDIDRQAYSPRPDGILHNVAHHDNGEHLRHLQVVEDEEADRTTQRQQHRHRPVADGIIRRSAIVTTSGLVGAAPVTVAVIKRRSLAPFSSPSGAGTHGAAGGRVKVRVAPLPSGMSTIW